jgi:hypothetical protein
VGSNPATPSISQARQFARAFLHAAVLSVAFSTAFLTTIVAQPKIEKVRRSRQQEMEKVWRAAD